MPRSTLYTNCFCPSTRLESITDDALNEEIGAAVDVKDPADDQKIAAPDYAEGEKAETPNKKHVEANDPKDAKEDLDKVWKR